PGERGIRMRGALPEPRRHGLLVQLVAEPPHPAEPERARLRFRVDVTVAAAERGGDSVENGAGPRRSGRVVGDGAVLYGGRDPPRARAEIAHSRGRVAAAVEPESDSRVND